MKGLRKAVGREQKATARIEPYKLPCKPFEIYSLSPHLALSDGHGTTTVNVRFTGFQFCFGAVTLYPLIFPLGREMIILCHCISAVFNFIFIF